MHWGWVRWSHSLGPRFPLTKAAPTQLTPCHPQQEMDSSERFLLGPCVDSLCKACLSSWGFSL